MEPMSGLLLLFGFAISAFAVGGLFDDSDGPQGDDTAPDDTSDVIIHSEFETALTDTLGAAEVEEIDFVGGALDVDTGAGNDLVAGGSEDDIINLGSGNDAATGGAGDDEIDLGSGDDQYGADPLAEIDPVFGNTDLGNDTVFGGDGDDMINDAYGTNILNGGAGNDFIRSVDAAAEETATPDQVAGGDGDDTIVVDEGDLVVSGSGNDDIRVVLGDGQGVIAGTQAVTIQDFDLENDALQLDGVFDVDDLRIEVFGDGTGATVFWNDTAVVRVVGGQNLTLADIVIAG
jgi:Ca2+-binding RTX toxin-like protein